jgi:hypothetical protein
MPLKKKSTKKITIGPRNRNESSIKRTYIRKTIKELESQHLNSEEW